MIKADITADSVISAGHSTGGIRAKEKVHLLSSGNPVGPITSQSLVTEEGSVWNGHCTMESPNRVVSETP